MTSSDATAGLANGSATPDIDALLADRVAASSTAALAGRTGTVLVDLGVTGQWTLTVAAGTTRVARGSSGPATTVIRTDATTFAALLDARESGASAFLDGRIAIRGDLSLGLQLDGAFVGERPLSHPRAAVVQPLGVPTSYLETGDPTAPPVVLLHGLGATNASLLPLALGLAETHRVLVPDLPGFGESGAPRWRYRASDYARWLPAYLRAVGAPRASLVGNSLGGRVAIEAALTSPALIDRIVLLCPAAALRAMRQFTPIVRLLSPELARPVPLPMAHRLVVSGIKTMFAKPSRLPASWYDAGADEFLRVMRRHGHRRAFFAALRQLYLDPPFGTSGFWPRLANVRAPALFVWGERDRLVPWRFARHVTDALPTAQSVVLPDCGHVPQFELPTDTLDLTREFLLGG